MKKIAIIGATGLLGKPVALAFDQAGFEVHALVRDPGPARKSFPSSIKIFPGDLRNETDVRKFLAGHTYLHLNLSVKQTERPTDWHAESEGLKTVLAVAKESGIKRLSYLSSLVQRYQGTNGFHWWVFQLKLDALERIRQSGIPHSLFFASTFMEAITTQYMQGSRLLIAGKSLHPQHFIASADYARQVVNAAAKNYDGNKEFIVQGPDAHLTEVALDIFRSNYKKKKLSISSAPMFMLKLAGRFNTRMNYGAHIIEALNHYPEKFEAQDTWSELGEPIVSIEGFAGTI